MDRPRDKTYPLVAELVAYGSRMMGNVKWAAVCGGIGAAFAAGFRHNDSSLQETPSTLAGFCHFYDMRGLSRSHTCNRSSPELAMMNRAINLSQVFAGQDVGVKQVSATAMRLDQPSCLTDSR